MPRGIIDKPYELSRREFKLVMDMQKWGREAACAEPNPDPGFLIERTNNASKNKEQEANAKEICGWCPVKAECLNHALKMPERGGIWGGLNEGEREELAKRLRRMKPEHWADV